MYLQKENKKRKLPAYLNDEEFLKVIKLVQKPHHKLAFMLAFNSGLRIGEVVSLQKENIDIQGKRIFIKNAKGGKDRVVPLPKKFPVKYLRYIPMKCGIRALQMAWKIYCKKAGIIKEGLCFHSLRHSFAVRAMNMGLPLNNIQLLLGHESISTTSIYLRINPKDALDKYEELW